jgi:hypothetical protein
MIFFLGNQGVGTQRHNRNILEYMGSNNLNYNNIWLNNTFCMLEFFDVSPDMLRQLFS